MSMPGSWRSAGCPGLLVTSAVLASRGLEPALSRSFQPLRSRGLAASFCNGADGGRLVARPLAAPHRLPTPRRSGRRSAAVWRIARAPGGGSVVESALVDADRGHWLRPAVLLPIAALAPLTPDQIKAIRSRARAHRRHDYAVNVLQTLAGTLLFYPGGLRISSGFAWREHCCDDIAVEICGVRRLRAGARRTRKLADIGATMALMATGGSL